VPNFWKHGALLFGAVVAVAHFTDYIPCISLCQ